MSETEARIRLLEANLIELATALAKGTAGKIHAIKAYRAATGMPLKESKDWVEALANFSAASAMPPAPSREDRLDQLEKRVGVLERTEAWKRNERPIASL